MGKKELLWSRPRQAGLSPEANSSPEGESPFNARGQSTDNVTPNDTSDKTGGGTLANIMPTNLPAAKSGRAYLAKRIKNTIRRATDPGRVIAQDRVLELRRVQEQIEASTGEKLPLDLDAYVMEALMGGRGGERMIDLRNKCLSRCSRMSAITTSLSFNSVLAGQQARAGLRV